MTDLLLAEQLLLLDRAGTAPAAPEVGYAGAVLLDLASENLVRMDGMRLGPINRRASHPLLAQARQIITSSDRFRAPEHWVHWIPAEMRKEDEGSLTVRLERSVQARGLDVSTMLGDVSAPSTRSALLIAVVQATGRTSIGGQQAREIAAAARDGSAFDAEVAQSVVAVYMSVFAALTPVISIPSL